MKQTNKVHVGITSAQVLNPQCSCTECDSLTCFSKRNSDTPCACIACTNSRSCLIYKENLTENKSHSINLNKRELASENITKNYKNDINYKINKTSEKTITKKYSRISCRTTDDGNEQKVTDTVSVKYSRKEVSPSTAQLTAQIMDVPYKDLQRSLTLTKPEVQSKVPMLSPYDIFNRIKEAYKACSCKVCECIAGKSLRNELCNCTPCECSDCASFKKNSRSITNIKAPADDEGCPCIRCDRSACKGINKKKTGHALECDCVGLLKCDIHTSKINSKAEACNCLPCQCSKCKLMSTRRQRTIVVAPVGEDYQQRNVCQCSPCECFNCGRSGYGMTENLHHEISTSVNRHPQCNCETCTNEACIPDGNQSCRCERQNRVMSKPFQRDSDDYDIHRAIVSYNDKREPIGNKYDTITMFAAVTNNYPKAGISKKQCHCDKCECLTCKFKTNMTHVSDVSNMLEPIQLHKKVCQCSPCDCQFCDKNNTEKRSDACACSVCDCLKCTGQIRTNVHEIMKPLCKLSPNGNCGCIPCQCADCKKITTYIGDICQCRNCKCESCIGTLSDEVIYPVKEKEFRTTSTFRNKRKDYFIDSCISTLETNKDILRRPLPQLYLKRPVFDSAQRDTQEDFGNSSYQTNNFQNQSSLFQHNFGSRTETVKHALISKYRNGTELHIDNENIELDFDPNPSSNSLMSYLKDNESITPVSPNSAETYLTDIMRLDYNKNNPNALNSKTKQHIHSTAMENNFLKAENFYEISQIENYENNPQRQESFKKDTHEVICKSSSNLTSSLRENYPDTQEISILLLDNDYDRVQKTLREAREFSQRLENILEKYEKDNREFKSVTERIKKSNESILNDDNILPNTENAVKYQDLKEDDVPTKEDNSKTFRPTTKEIVEINMDTDKKSDVLPYDCNYSDLDVDFSHLKKKIDKNDELMKTTTVEKETIDIPNKQVRKNKTSRNLNRSYCRMYRRSIVCSKQLKKPTHSPCTELSYINGVQTNLPTIKQIKAMLQNEDKMTIIIRDKVGTNKFSQNQAFSPKHVIKSTTELSVSMSETHNKDSQKDVIQIEKPMVVESSVLKKNFYLDTSVVNGRNAVTPVEDNVKSAVRSIGKALESKNENTRFFWNNEALVKLHSEVKKLLDLPVLNNLEGCRNYENGKQKHNELSKTVSSQTNQEMKDVYIAQKADFLGAVSSRKICESLKVNFLNVRRVSDHTVLVKWHLPDVLNNVVGYELLVDGRAVQKLLGPSRRMAVVTCLPHSDRVLLTVRTVISDPCPATYAPAATVIYQPKGR